MLIAIAIVVALLIVAFGVAAWQVAREDRIARAAMGERVDGLVRREGLHVASVGERDGVTTIALRGDSGSQPRS